MIRPAPPADLGAVLDLLEACDLPVDGVAAAFGTFLVATGDAGAVVGSARLEARDDEVLLRSLAVAPPHRGRGIGDGLFREIVAVARARGARRAWLLTGTAAPVFAHHGFEVAARDDAPEEIRETVEFREACPESATCMARHLE